MTEIEDTLSRVLTVEADRHEPPVFDAGRIAEGAVRGKLWRRPLFAVVAGTIAVAGGGGAAVFAAAGGHSSGGRVTVTFRNSAFVNTPIPLADGDVQGWVRQTIAAEGLKDVEVSATSKPFQLVVAGRAADLPKLKALLGTPVVLQIPQVEYPPTMPITPPGVDDSENSDYHVVYAQAEPPAAGAEQGSGGWRVAVRLDPESARMLAGVARNGGQIAAMVDGTVRDRWDTAGLDPAGVLTINGSYTEREARTLAAKLSEQGPPGVEGTVVTVTRP